MGLAGNTNKPGVELLNINWEMTKSCLRYWKPVYKFSIRFFRDLKSWGKVELAVSDFLLSKYVKKSFFSIFLFFTVIYRGKLPVNYLFLNFR